jgi:hypothetical protein
MEKIAEDQITEARSVVCIRTEEGAETALVQARAG